MGVDPILDESQVYYTKVQDVNQLQVLTVQSRDAPFVQSTNVLLCPLLIFWGHALAGMF